MNFGLSSRTKFCPDQKQPVAKEALSRQSPSLGPSQRLSLFILLRTYVLQRRLLRLGFTEPTSATISQTQTAVRWGHQVLITHGSHRTLKNGGEARSAVHDSGSLCHGWNPCETATLVRGITWPRTELRGFASLHFVSGVADRSIAEALG